MLGVNSVKQSDTKCHSEPCPERRRRSGEESKWDRFVAEFILSGAEGLLAMTVEVSVWYPDTLQFAAGSFTSRL